MELVDLPRLVDCRPNYLQNWWRRMPTTVEIPPIEIEYLETPPISPVNFRGVGEGGAICALPAITNVISDALGVKITRQPLTPTRILELSGVIPATP